MLSICDLTIQFTGNPVLKNIFLDIQKGESVALMGANGTGKTSLLKSLVYLQPYTGTIQMDNLVLSRKTAAEFREKIGFIFQNPDDQLFCPTIEQDLSFGLENKSIPEKEIQNRVKETLEMFGLQSFASRSAQSLSGGEKRMASLAAVMIMRPEMLILDEPTIFLDARARKILVSALNDLTQTKIIATHDIAFAQKVCTRVVILNHGSIAADAQPDLIFADHTLMENSWLE